MGYTMRIKSRVLINSKVLTLNPHFNYTSNYIKDTVRYVRILNMYKILLLLLKGLRNRN